MILRAIVRSAAVALTGVTLLAGAAADLDGQIPGRFAGEARAGASAGNVDVSRASLSPTGSFAWSVGGLYEPIPFLALYAGFDRSPFTCQEDRGFCAVAAPRFISQGVSVEARVVLPIPGYRPWAGVGTGMRSFASELDGERRTSDWAPAFTASAGAEIPVLPRVVLAPGVRFLRHAHDWDDPHATRETVTVFAADVGLRFRF